MDKKDGIEVPWWQPGIVLFAKLSGWIIGPILVAIFIGKYLDDKYNTDPWLFLLSVGVAFGLSTFGIIRDALIELKRIEKEEEAKKEDR